MSFAVVTETALFRACVEKPKSNLRVQDMYLERVKEPSNPECALTPDQIASQKAIKLFHSAWSGITKYMRTMCLAKGRAVELNDIGFFVPMREVNAAKGADEGRRPTGLTSSALGKF